MSIRHGFPERRPPVVVHPPAPCTTGRTPCTNIFARPLTPVAPGWPEMVSVVLDGQDRLESVSEAWNSFVERAGMGHLRGRTIVGRPIGHFISDTTVRDTFRALFHNMRRTGRPARLIARCDPPGGPPRAMWLEFVPLDDGGIGATWRFAHGSDALRVPLVRRTRFLRDELIRACGWCWRIRLATGWYPIDHVGVELGLLDRNPLPLVTHGICPRCAATLRAECAHAFAG